MKTIRFPMIVALIGAGLLTAAASAQDVQPGEQVARRTIVETGDGESLEIRYWLYVPESYDGEIEMPLMLFLHGAGERGDDLDVVKKWGPPRIVEDRADFPFIVASPQCPAGQRWNATAMARLVDGLAGELAVDRTRMYVTGLSMGGYGSWLLLAEFPDLFAAAVPICGGGNPDTAERFAHVPIWAFHGDADSVVPLEQTTRMVEAVNEAGGHAELTVYEGVGHNSWSETYANEGVYIWMLRHRRDD